MGWPSWIGVTGALLAAIAALIAPNRPRIGRWAGFVAAGIMALATVASQRQNSQTESELKAATQQLLVDSRKSLEWASRNDEVTDRLLNVQAELQHKTQEIADLNYDLALKSEELKSYATGGDSYCYVDIFTESATRVGIRIIHKGQYPLFGVQARIVDLAQFNEQIHVRQRRTAAGLSSAERIVDVGTLNPGYVYTYPTPVFNLPNQTASYNIFFATRSGNISQNLRLFRAGGRWLRALRVSRENVAGDAMITLYESVSEGFPLTDAGEVEW